MMKITERDITDALKLKNKDNIFASQVKMGAAGSKIIDAIAIKKSWSPITVIGYEIKVSRYDFLNDQKFPHYMQTCNLFYFVAPKGIISKDELPADVGLIEYNPNANVHKLRTVKKAPYRNVEIMVDMLLHIMFWKFDEYSRPKSRNEYLDDVKAKVESLCYGHELSNQIRQYKTKINRLESDLEYERNNSDWTKFCKFFKEKLGFKPSYPFQAAKYIVDNNEIESYMSAIRLLERAYNELPRTDHR